ncbi:MAG: hypothetical protein JNK25_07700 [Phycisphaerae bacterium]|nr:hypothetical protein [Phycisphaerae bacterium]
MARIDPKKVEFEKWTFHLYGANHELHDLIERGKVYFRDLPIPHDEFVGRCAVALAAELDKKRFSNSVDLCKLLWRARRELPPHPLFDVLLEAQPDRVFWWGYREHAAHMFKVFLLGLYLYDRCEWLRAQLHADDTGDDAPPGTTTPGRAKPLENMDGFLTAWTCAALFHDAGYVFECEAANDPAHWFHKRVLGTINASLGSPFAAARNELDGLKMNHEAEDANAAGLTVEALTLIDDVFSWPTAIGPPNALGVLHRLDTAAKRSGLGQPNADHPIAAFHTLSTKWQTTPTRPGEAPRVVGRDHGVAGAALLLRLQASYENRLAGIAECPASKRQALNRLGEETAEADVRSRLDLAKKNRHAVHAAAQALALHNINLRHWGDEDRNAAKLSHHDRYRIPIGSLRREPKRGCGCPLAFLLGLADSLQVWDRPRNVGKGSPDEIGSQDFDMAWRARWRSRGSLAIWFRAASETDLSGGNKPPDFRAVHANLKEYLEPAVIDKLVFQMPVRKKLTRAQRVRRIAALATAAAVVSTMGVAYLIRPIARDDLQETVVAGVLHTLDPTRNDSHPQRAIAEVKVPESKDGVSLFVRAVCDVKSGGSSHVSSNRINRIEVVAPPAAAGKVYEFWYRQEPWCAIFNADLTAMIRVQVLEPMRVDKPVSRTVEKGSRVLIDYNNLDGLGIVELEFFNQSGRIVEPFAPKLGRLEAVPRVRYGSRNPDEAAQVWYIADDRYTGPDEFKVIVRTQDGQKKLISTVVEVREKTEETGPTNSAQ